MHIKDHHALTLRALDARESGPKTCEEISPSGDPYWKGWLIRNIDFLSDSNLEICHICPKIEYWIHFNSNGDKINPPHESGAAHVDFVSISAWFRWFMEQIPP